VIRSWVSSVGIATIYWLDDRAVGSLLHVVHTGSGAHPVSYPMGTGALSPGIKRLGSAADHSPPTIAEVKKTWIYISTPPYVFMA
jgi:hypothetical protein